MVLLGVKVNLLVLNQVSTVILSALLTSIGINLGLCLLFFTLYSILRKQPGNITVYAPRLVAEGKVKEGGHFNLERLLPTTFIIFRPICFLSLCTYLSLGDKLFDCLYV